VRARREGVRKFGARAAERERGARRYNFDHPDAIDFELLVEQLAALKARRTIAIPDYDFTKHQRVGTHSLEPADIIILDGIFILAVERVRKSCDLTIFTMEDSDVCLARRLRRDISERGRTLESVLVQYERFVKPGFQTFIQPTMSKADLIIPRARDNHRAIHTLARDLATQVLKYKRKMAGIATPAPRSALPTDEELADALLAAARDGGAASGGAGAGAGAGASAGASAGAGAGGAAAAATAPRTPAKHT
jgi:uridine kinase